MARCALQPDEVRTRSSSRAADDADAAVAIEERDVGRRDPGAPLGDEARHG
jgi:hypothetical protein